MSSTEAKRAMHEQKAEQHAAQASEKGGQATAAAGQSATEATQVRFEYSVCLYKPHGLFRRELFLLVVHPVRREGENSCFQVAQHALHTSPTKSTLPNFFTFLNHLPYRLQRRGCLKLATPQNLLPTKLQNRPNKALSTLPM